MWNLNQEYSLLEFITNDETFLETQKLRKSYKWSLLLSDISNDLGVTLTSRLLATTERNLRRWRQGTRTPKHNKLPKILKIAEENKLNLNRYQI